MEMLFSPTKTEKTCSIFVTKTREKMQSLTFSLSLFLFLYDDSVPA